MADPDSSLTPEQKLLKIIEQDSPQTATGGAASGVEKPTGGGSGLSGFNIFALLSPSAIKGRIAYAKDYLQSYLKGHKDPLDLRKINRAVKMMTAGVAIYLSGAIVYEVVNVNHSYESDFKMSPKEIAEPPTVETKKIDPSLFEEVEKRNIFIPQEKRALEAAGQQPQSNPIRLVELIKDLRLTGISINPEDDAKSYCMIEDIKKNITSFLRAGDMISGLKVDQITSDEIVLKNQNDSIELR